MKCILLNIITFFLLVQSGFGSANDPPLVTCLEVHEAGDVTIYWQSLDITALEFQIFFSTDIISWTQAGSVDTPNTSLQFHHTTALANDQAYYYYIKVIYQTVIDSSDVFSTIFLVADNSTIGLASLFWNPVHDPLPEGSSTYYKIYKSLYEVGMPHDWILADSTEGTLYNYVIEDGLCHDSINFKIEIENSYGCSSVSNVAGDWFGEDNQPEKPVFDSVSISANSHVILGWEPSVSADVSGTVIYRDDSGVWDSIFTVVPNGTSFFIDSAYQPCIENYRYAIAAIDSCGKKSPATFSTPLRPIFLYDITYNLCSETNTLTWEHYINAPLPFGKYEIWSSKNNGATALVDEVAANVNHYGHTGVENATEYSYFVRAVFGDLDFTSTSCTKTITTGTFVKPRSVYLANADVLPGNDVELTIDVDLNPNSCTWEIMRSNAGGGSQSLLTALLRNEITTSPHTYLDETADGSTGYYTYSIDVYDSCGALALQSNTMKTIFLGGGQLSDIENHLSWNSFEGFDGGVDKYYVFRMLGDIMPVLPIDSTDALTTEYTDNTSTVDAGESKFSYWAQAVEGSPNSYGHREKSNSNIVSLFREINFYFPNAFRPNGTNNVFKPVATGFGGSNYLFQVFNRWGQLIFESSDPELGWDGKYNGTQSPQGTYVYRLVYQNVFDVTKQQRGTVTLID